jgi:hypothetical protein
MKSLTLKLENLADAKIVNRSSEAYKRIKTALESDTTIRTCWVNGTGRYSTNYDITMTVKVILDSIGCKYIMGNDAHRKGKAGTFIKIQP